MRSKSILLVVIILLTCGVGVQAVTMDWVSVGNAGNAADSTGYGGVSDVYQISTYEVTAGQYTEFLNAVADTDSHGLYNTSMWSIGSGCKIQQSGSSGSYSYSVASDYANRPVNYVSWYDTLRFSNWLHNGQGAGDTEDGAYDMLLGSSVVRKAGAQVWLPSEDEWYKAAYHKNDGVTGNYFDYPTSSNNISTTMANYDNSVAHTTDVGSYSYDSSYGTFDQGGNVWEWNESLIFGEKRGIRGGSFSDGGLILGSSARYISYPDIESFGVGFRVASVPEPATLLLLGLGAVLLRRKKPKAR